MTKTLTELVKPLQGHAYRAPGHVQRRWHEFQHLGQTTGEKRLVLEMCRSHRTAEQLPNLFPAQVTRQVQHMAQTTDDPGLKVRCERALKRTNQFKRRTPKRDGFCV